MLSPNFLRTSSIIDYFKKSTSFSDAITIANLFDELMINYISSVEWKEILEAFFQNNQIYGSRVCVNTFESLFKKSIKIDASVKPYWLSFRDKLNSFGNHYRYINSLKQVIDYEFQLE
ncbi:MAG: hypothetical protein AAFR37_04610 [Cyanobacteria bacterium J06628_3]